MWCVLHPVNAQAEEMVALRGEQKEIFEFSKNF